MFKYWLLSLFAFATSCYGKQVESIDETELLHLIKAEAPVIVLFSKKKCELCEKYEIALENIHEDLNEMLGAEVVKIYNSPMLKLYDITKEPSLLMIRSGIPLLYHGNIQEEEMLLHFSDNRDPVTKELSDINFELLTQASTGATTGDWFVFFYSSECIPCQRLYAIWEAVAANLKRRLNVARVNRKLNGVLTAKRFKIEKAPEFILIRQGKFYRYKSSDYAPQALIKFAEEGFTKESSSEEVPPVSDPMGSMINIVRNFIIANPNLVIYGGLGLAIVLVGVNCAVFLMKKKETKDKKSKRKEK